MSCQNINVVLAAVFILLRGVRFPPVKRQSPVPVGSFPTAIVVPLCVCHDICSRINIEDVLGGKRV
jgi:hypothetical protein